MFCHTTPCVYAPLRLRLRLPTKYDTRPAFHTRRYRDDYGGLIVYLPPDDINRLVLDALTHAPVTVHTPVEPPPATLPPPPRQSANSNATIPTRFYLPIARAFLLPALRCRLRLRPAGLVVPLWAVPLTDTPSDSGLPLALTFSRARRDDAFWALPLTVLPPTFILWDDRHPLYELRHALRPHWRNTNRAPMPPLTPLRAHYATAYAIYTCSVSPFAQRLQRYLPLPGQLVRGARRRDAKDGLRTGLPCYPTYHLFTASAGWLSAAYAVICLL